MTSHRKPPKLATTRRQATARGRAATSSTGRNSKPGSTRTSPGWDRHLIMGGLAIAGTAAVIIVAIALTPLNTELPSQDASQREPSPAGASRSNSLAGQGASTNQQALTPSVSLQASSPPREFPTEAAPIDVAQMQQELVALAHTLETDFANDPLAFHVSGQIYQELKQTQLAEAAWRKCLEQGVAAPGPYAGLAQLLIKSGRESEAVELLSTAHASGTQSQETFRELAEAQENLGLLTEAKATLDRVLELYPDDAEPWLAHGRVLMQLKDYEQAEASTLRNIELGGESEKALVALSTAQVRQKKMAEAAVTRQRLVQLQKNNASSSDSFQEVYDSALRRVSLELFLSCSALALENQRPAAAEKYSWRAIELEPGSGRAYMSLIAVQRAQGQLSEALATVRHLVAIQPENPLNYVNLASLATQLGNVAEAKQALARAVALDPHGFVAHNSLVRLHMALGEFAEAKRVANQILEHHLSVEAYLLLAQVLEGADEPIAASQAVHQAKLLDPNHPVWESLPSE